MRDLFCMCLAFTAVSACHDSNPSSDAEMSTPADMQPADMRPRSPGGSCFKNDDCLKLEFCNWPPEHVCGYDQTAGVCTFTAEGCTDDDFVVCGCDNNSYASTCEAYQPPGRAVAYGGPCRAGNPVHCFISKDCPQDQKQYFVTTICVDDPSDNCVSTSDDGGMSTDSGDGGVHVCPGLCAHALYPCSASLPCDSEAYKGRYPTIVSSGTEVCIASTDDPNSGWCVFTTGASCQSQNDCRGKEVCMPHFGCDRASGAPCPSVCVRL
jgi:hypothetical protein